MTMELFLFPEKYIHLLKWGWVYGGLLIFGTLSYLLLIGTAIHRAPRPKNNSVSVRVSMGTSNEGPTVPSRSHPSKNGLLPRRSSVYLRADAARNVPTRNRV
jgi:hypothetical protein